MPARERAQAEGAARESTCPFRFPGQYEGVETGLNYNRHRYYDALTGQYCSPDPIGLAGGDRPQGYVDRPGSGSDPLGLAAKNSDTITGYRAISKPEADDIIKTGKFNVVPGGVEGKYFSTSKKGAEQYRDMSKKFPGEPQTIIVKSKIPKSSLDKHSRVSVDRGVDTVVVPSKELPKLIPEFID